MILKIVIARDGTDCPPWARDWDFEGTEEGVRAEIQKDAQSIGVRYHYLAFESEPGLWHVWRSL